jgi:hypothetical protein
LISATVQDASLPVAHAALFFFTHDLLHHVPSPAL